MTIRSFSYGSTLIAYLMLLTGCAVNPVTGKSELAFISQGEELAIGAEQYVPSQQSQGGTYSADPELGAYVSEVGQRLARVSDRALPYEFVVLNNGVPNAWALPGGKIAVNRGLLTELNNEAELAAVLGHEVVHAAARHSANQMQRGLLLQGALLATAISTASSEYSNYIVGGAQVGAQLLSQTYSRSAELEADLYGTGYMKRAGYNPAAAVSLQETFVRLSEGRSTGWLQGMFASHPPSMERVEKNKETVARLGETGDFGEARFKQKMAYLRSKADAYAAFDQANTLASSKDFAPALGRLNQAIAIEPKEARFHGLKGDILLVQNNYQAATRAFTDALAIDDNYYEYYLGRGLARSKLGEKTAARADFERSNQLLPTAVASNELGQLSLAAGDTRTAKRYFQAAMNAEGAVGSNAAAAFFRLDVPENPGRYIEAGAFVSNDGQLMATVRNKASLAVTRLELEFQAIVNGNPVRQVVSLTNIGSNQQGNVASGMQFAASDIVEAIGVRVISAAVR